MLDEVTKKAKLTHFANDLALSTAVREVLEEAYLKKSEDRDVNNLASRFLALELLDKAWNVVLSYKTDIKKDTKSNNNLGM